MARDIEKLKYPSIHKSNLLLQQGSCSSVVIISNSLYLEKYSSVFSIPFDCLPGNKYQVEIGHLESSEDTNPKRQWIWYRSVLLVVLYLCRYVCLRIRKSKHIFFDFFCSRNWWRTTVQQRLFSITCVYLIRIKMRITSRFIVYWENISGEQDPLNQLNSLPREKCREL